MANKPYVRKPVKGSPNSVRKAGQRRDKFGEIGANVGTVAGVLPFVSGQGVAGIAVDPLAVAGGYVGRKVGRRIGHGVAHVANLATLLHRDQFRDYL